MSRMAPVQNQFGWASACQFARQLQDTNRPQFMLRQKPAWNVNYLTVILWIWANSRSNPCPDPACVVKTNKNPEILWIRGLGWTENRRGADRYIISAYWPSVRNGSCSRSLISSKKTFRFPQRKRVDLWNCCGFLKKTRHITVFLTVTSNITAIRSSG